MDGTPLYPKGFHPGRHGRSISVQHSVRGRYRLHAPPVSYYLIDFGLSTKYQGDGPYTAWGTDGQDRDAPELMYPGPSYDPFALDIFTLGNVYKKSLLDVCIRLSLACHLLTALFSTEIREPYLLAYARG